MKTASGLYVYGILTKMCHKHVIKTAGNCVKKRQSNVLFDIKEIPYYFLRSCEAKILQVYQVSRLPCSSATPHGMTEGARSHGESFQEPSKYAGTCSQSSGRVMVVGLSVPVGPSRAPLVLMSPLAVFILVAMSPTVCGVLVDTSC